jgi:hypothetical protein
MVDLIKRRAKKPVIEDGHVWTGTAVKWSQANRAGFVHATDNKFTLTMVGAGEKSAEYVAEFSEIEMFSIVSAWIDIQKNRRLREEFVKQEKTDGRQP